MSTRQLLVVAAAGIHLILVVGGAANFSLPRSSGIAGRGIRWYAAVSGADSSFGFFAPGVASETRATFTLSDGAGRTWTEAFESGGNQELQLRLGSMVSMAASSSMRNKLAASWAGKFFAIHPEVESVLVRFEFYDLPSMDEYRDGERPEWVTDYEVEFFRNESLSQEVDG